MNDGNAQIPVRRTGQVDLHGHSSGPIEYRYLGPPHGVVKVRRSRMILTHVKAVLERPELAMAHVVIKPIKRLLGFADRAAPRRRRSDEGRSERRECANTA